MHHDRMQLYSKKEIPLETSAKGLESQAEQEESSLHSLTVASHAMD